jgi:hypothetical protein
MTNWTAPATATDGAILTKAYLDTNVRDNPLNLREIVTGTNAEKVAVAAGAIRPQARVYHSATTAIGNGVQTRLAFDSELFDTDGMHDLVSGLGFGERLTAKTQGLYSISAHVQFASNATGIRQLYLQVNGATIIAMVTTDATSGGANTDMSIETKYRLAVNDYVEVWVQQTSGGNLNLNSAPRQSREFVMVHESNY